MAGKELKDYTRKELEAELARRRPFEGYNPERARPVVPAPGAPYAWPDAEEFIAELRWLRGHGCEDECNCDCHESHPRRDLLDR